MGMSVFDLVATLRLDSSEYEKGLGKAKGFASSFGSTLKTVMGIQLVEKGIKAMGDFAKSSIEAGKNFDSSMSQVAATMGKTMDEMQNEVGTVQLAWGEFSGNLREFAQEMGKNTAFSATEAADALNYMALAGYTTQESMTMLPNVLNLAAAGSMDLARASDMVTDTQTAFGLKMEEMPQLVDEMAKAASTGNTSVEQLGDAFLTVGGLAQELNGGFVTLANGTQEPVSGIQEMEIALTAMANAGIKGAEAGTHMRNMIMKLSNPTSDGVETMEALGISVFDTEGNMRSLADIMGDLSGALDDVTQEEKIQAISSLFNTRDLASAEALLNAVNEDWDSIGESILDAEGAAQQMADTQLDNLEGDITLFKSALEGAQIAISDGITPTLREFVRFGTDGLSELTSAFQEGGLSGAMSKLGDLLSEAVGMLTQKLPDIADGAVELISAFAKGLIDNLPKIAETAMTIVTNLGQKLADNADKITPAIATLYDKLADIAIKNLPTIIDLGIKILMGLVEGFTKALPKVIQIIPKLVEAIAKLAPQLVVAGLAIAQALFDGLIKSLPVIIDAIPQIIGAITDMIIGGDSITKIIEGAITLFTSMLDALPQIINTVVQMIPQIITAIVTALMKATPQLVVAGVDLFVALIKDAPKIVSLIISLVPMIITSLVTGFVNAWPQIKQAGNQMLEGLAKAIPDIINKLKGEVPKIISSMVSRLREGVSQLRTVGANLIEGLYNGIKNKFEWVVSLVGSLAQSVINKAKSVFREKSPSRVFYEIGDYLGVGLGMGWEDSMKDVNKQIGKDLNYKGTIDVTAKTNLAEASAVSAERSLTDTDVEKILSNLSITMYNTTEIDGQAIKKDSYKYTVTRMGDETRAVKVAMGGF